MTLLEVSSHRHDAIVHVVVSGELDLSTVGRLESELARIEAEDPPTIVLDLKQVTFLDSSGLRVVVAADQRARGTIRRFAVVRGPETVQRIFEITRLDEQLDLIDDFASLG
ncbi:MAG: STAS domain-containing protein [Solirubrobacterales bacterium]|nr:STAS domain-containing protein [Solirubrobacterales bacterium]